VEHAPSSAVTKNSSGSDFVRVVMGRFLGVRTSGRASSPARGVFESITRPPLRVCGWRCLHIQFSSAEGSAAS
jgi:hypothetical protein